MKLKTYNLLNLSLTCAGFLFSGYLSATKFFTSNCAYQEPCPFFLGHPACYFGFGLFSTLFITSILAFAGKIPIRGSCYAIRTVSFGGVLFAGYFVLQEVIRYAAAGFEAGALVLTTCAWGLLFFLIIFGLSFHNPATHEQNVEVSKGAPQEKDFRIAH
jgi:hypothetical protein